MATFQIHHDDENNVPKFCKAKDALKNVQKRSVLGTINLNNRPSSNNDLLSKKDILELSEQENCHNQLNICQPECKPIAPTVEHSKHEVVKNREETELSENAYRKTPVVELKKDEKAALKVQSPMSVDVTPKPPHVSVMAFTSDIFAKTDPLLICPPYDQDIFNYLKILENEFKAKAYYMKRQPDVTYAMRTILVDWLVEVGEEYRLHNETLFMAVSLIDRFLSSMAVVRTKLQLLGTSALFISSKFEEIYPPEATEFTYITDDTYTKKQLLRMEHLLLKVLSFDLSAPTAYTFISHISAVFRLPARASYLAMYIAELSLLEGDPYLEYTPSAIGCASIILANHCLEQVDIWPKAIADSAGYTLVSLATIIGHLCETHAKSFTAQQQASREKYSRDKYYHVSQVPARKLEIRDPLGPS